MAASRNSLHCPKKLGSVVRISGLLFFVSLFAGAIPAPSGGDDLKFDTWSSASDNGCIGFCAQLSANEQNTLRAWVHETELMGAISDARFEATLKKAGGIGIKNVGYAAESFSSAQAGGAGLGLNLVGRNLVDLGDYIGEQAEEALTRRTILEIDRKYTSVISPNGKINRDELQKIKDGELKFFFSNNFKDEIGNPAILSQFYSQVSIDMLVESLGDTKEIKDSVEDLNKQIKLNGSTLDKIAQVQQQLVADAKEDANFLSGVQSTLIQSHTIVTQLAARQLPPAQVIALIDSGVLQVDLREVEGIRKAARMERIQGEFNRAADAFGGFTQGLDQLGLHDLARATNDISNLLTSGGAFAVAYISGDPLAIAQTGLGLVGVVAGLGKKPKESAETKMLKMVLSQIHELRKEMFEYHKQEMEALQTISKQVADLRSFVGERFSEIAFDLAIIQVSINELLADDLKDCDRLVNEFFVEESQQRFAQEADAFAKWFAADNRPVEYNNCMSALIKRQTVGSETDFSQILRSFEIVADDAKLDAKTKREKVRNIEMHVLQPTVAFIQRFGSKEVDVAKYGSLLRPEFSICNILMEPEGGDCAEGTYSWETGTVATPNYNPGGGQLLSVSMALKLAKYTRTIAPWNTALTDGPGGLPRVLTVDEMRDLSQDAAAARTRHMLALQNALETIDLVIAQQRVLAGTPVIARAAKLLREQVLPAYAQARLNGDTTTIDKLFSDVALNDSCDTGNEAADLLCVMEHNTVFASNVIRAVVKEGLAESKATWDQWHREASVPQSARINALLGEQIIIQDATIGVPNRTAGAWAIELPRIGQIVEDKKKFKKPDPASFSCWNRDSQPRLAKDDFYSQPHSGTCISMDSQEDGSDLNFAGNYRELLAERFRLTEMLKAFCANIDYPGYCQ